MTKSVEKVEGGECSETIYCKVGFTAKSKQNAKPGGLKSEW